MGEREVKGEEREGKKGRERGERREGKKQREGGKESMRNES